MSFAQIQLTVNMDTKLVVKDTTAVGLRQRPTSPPELNYNEINILCVHFVDSAGVNYALEADDEFKFALDSSRRAVTDTDDIMAYSANAVVDVAGDWADISRANGKISIRVDSGRDLFESRITEADGNQRCYGDLVLQPNGSNNWSMCLSDIFVCSKNVISKYH